MNESNTDVSQTYQLSGDGVVTVHKPFGNAHYVAVVKMSGEYPAAGQRARNVGRDEYIVVLEGSFVISVDGKSQTYGEGSTVFVPDGSIYSIVGSGRSLVVVNDKPEGKTEIES